MWATFNNRERKHLERKFDSMKLDEIVAYGRNGLKIGKIKNVNSGTRLAGESDERYEPSFVFFYKIPCGKTQGFNLGMIARHRLTLR